MLLSPFAVLGQSLLKESLESPALGYLNHEHRMPVALSPSKHGSQLSLEALSGV